MHASEGFTTKDFVRPSSNSRLSAWNADNREMGVALARAEAGTDRASETTVLSHRMDRNFVSENSGEGAEERFTRIMREYGPAWSRLAFGYEKGEAAREELVQEIALAVWQALPHFRGECSERTFIYRIAHNRGLTHA